MIQLTWDNEAQTVDLSRADGENIDTSELLNTAVFISLFTRRRALNDDVLPEPLGHREGWWGDAYPEVDGDLIGSRLWLTGRGKITSSTMNDIRVYAEEALQWFIDDGIASSVVVEVEHHRDDIIAFKVEMALTTGARWSEVYTAHMEQL
jgi:phage gp46-like protein